MSERAGLANRDVRQIRARLGFMSDAWSNRIALLGLVGVVLGALSAKTVVDLDIFHEMALFRQALAIGRIPIEDTFSYVPTVSPMIHHEWGTGALLYLVTVSCGLGASGLMILKYMLSAGVVTGCYLYARREGARTAVFVPLAFVAINLGNIGFSTIRAHLFSLLFLVILFLFLQEDRRGKRWWIAVWLPLHIVWVNLHAGFVLGLGLIVLHTLERLLGDMFARRRMFEAFWGIKHLIGVALAMVLMILLNPYGLEYVPYLYHGLTLDRSSIITEWRPIWDPVHKDARILIPLHGFCISVLAYSAYKLKFRDMPHLSFLLVTAWLSVFHIRYLSVFYVAWICCVPAYVGKTKIGEVLGDFWTKRKTSLFAFWMTLGVLGLLLATHRQFWHLKIPTAAAEHEERGVLIYPVGGVDYLASHGFKGNLMVPFSAGSYVSWKLYPDVKVSLDSRFEVAYPVKWAVEQVQFYQGKDGWEETLNRYPTDAVLVPRYSPIENLLEQQATTSMAPNAIEWRRVYTDDGYSIFIRSHVADRFVVVDNTGKQIVGRFP